jgi:hypothetical protein
MFLTRHNFHFLLATFIFFFWHCGASSSCNLFVQIAFFEGYAHLGLFEGFGNIYLVQPSRLVVTQGLHCLLLELFLEIRVT